MSRKKRKSARLFEPQWYGSIHADRCRAAVANRTRPGFRQCQRKPDAVHGTLCKQHQGSK